MCVSVYTCTVCIHVWKYLWQLIRNHSHWRINNNRYDSVKISTNIIDFIISYSPLDNSIISRLNTYFKTTFLYTDNTSLCKYSGMMTSQSSLPHSQLSLLTRKKWHSLFHIDQKWRNFIYHLTAIFSVWIFPGKNTGVGCHSLLQGIFPTKGSNPLLFCLLHWQGRFFH